MTQKKINIAFIIDQMNIGGTEKQLVEIINLLDKNLFTVFLVCLKDNEYFQNLNLPCRKLVFPTQSLLSKNGLKMLFKFVQFLKHEKIDIVQTFFIDSNIFGVIGARIAGVKKIIVSRRDLGFWYTKKLLFILRIINKFSHRFMVNSNAIKQVVSQKEKVATNKVDVIYNGIDLEPFVQKHNTGIIREKIGIPEKDYIVGIVANLNRHVKRVDIFIQAAALVLKKMANVSFVIVGDGHLKSSLNNLAQELCAEKKIYFVGSQDNVYPFLQLFDIGVLTSDSEGFSNSILEYMAAGLPVVCTDVGGNSELICDDINGYLVEKDNSFQFAEAIINLLTNEKKVAEIKANSNVISNYSLKNIGLHINDYYKQYMLY